MLDSLERSLIYAYDRASRLARGKQAVADQSLVGLLTSGSPMFAAASGHTNLTLAREQYEHYRGRVYSAIRVITQRIAGQPVYVARVTDSAGADRVSRRGRRKQVARDGGSGRTLKSLLAEGRIKPGDVPPDVKHFGPDRLEILDDHPLRRALDDPNELMVRSTLFGMTIPSWLITGRAFWLLSAGKTRREITPIPTTWVRPRHTANRPRAEWEIRPPGRPGEPLVVPCEMMAHFYFADPSNPLGSISPLQMQARAILADESIQSAQHVAFRNSVNPHVALIAGDVTTKRGTGPVRLTSAQRKHLTTWFKQEYQGVRKFGLPIVLDALIRDVKVLSHKPAEMGFLDSSSVTKADIYEGFGVNPISAGQVDGANRASSAIADRHLCVNTVNPMLATMSEVMTKWVAPLFAADNERLRVWIAPCEPNDPLFELKKWEFAARHFCVDQNEIRTRLLGLPAWKQGERVAVPAETQFQSVSPVDE